ncbi:HEAT repeat domain-containing protein [Leucobacter coleopterorum]|uniref:HEAT repeat domain-containing protein n=1 Tax=Leucobacter coleopterorum TaxID=2714933 RepID=A0ABX6K0L9_9MICO|nr:HEAT repeat domain-containing protein [Leucobacter coleopterorum]QIM18615.1 HEAT repeat domain-containing protein [Leucobacter coleopterorum]
MSKATAYAEHLAPLNASARTDFLNTHSGLPGPRGNLELLWGFARVAEHDHVQQLIPAQDEYLRSAAALGLGRLALETSSSDYLEQLTALAADHSWRVREAVAMAAQLIGDSDGEQFRALVSRWAESPDPLVQRAAVAGVCEPRLLKDPASARLAVSCALESPRLMRSTAEKSDVTTRSVHSVRVSVIAGAWLSRRFPQRGSRSLTNSTQATRISPGSSNTTSRRSDCWGFASHRPRHGIPRHWRTP